MTMLTSRSPSRRALRRSGFTIGELFVAVLLLGLAFAVAAQTVAVYLGQRRVASRQFVAQIEAGNGLERAWSLAASNPTADQLRAITLDPQSARVLPRGALTLSITEEESDGLKLRRIASRVTWDDGNPSVPLPRSIELVGWLPAPAPASGTLEKETRE